MARESGRAEDIADDKSGEGTKVREPLLELEEVSWHPENQSSYYLKDIAQSLRILVEGFGYPRKDIQERCGDSKCNGPLDHQGTCTVCGYDW